MKFWLLNIGVWHDLYLRNMLLLENQSTVKLFCNKRFVTIVWTTNYSITVKGNGETAKTTRKPYIKVYGEVWFYELSITNILVLNNIERNFIFTYDSNNYVARGHPRTALSMLYAWLGLGTQVPRA